MNSVSLVFHCMFAISKKKTQPYSKLDTDSKNTRHAIC